MHAQGSGDQGVGEVYRCVLGSRSGGGGCERVVSSKEYKDLFAGKEEKLVEIESKCKQQGYR